MYQKDEIYDISKSALKTLASHEVEEGDFAKITFSGYEKIGSCDEDNHIRINHISDCEKLSPTEALALRTHEVIPIPQAMNNRLRQSYQNSQADFVMFPVHDKFYAYTPDSDTPVILDTISQVLDYFKISTLEQESGA